STKPSVEAGSNLGQGPSGVRVWVYPPSGGAVGLEMFFQYWARGGKTRRVAWVGMGGGRCGRGGGGAGAVGGGGGGGQRARGGGGAGGDVVELEPGVERGALADALDGAALVAEVVCGGDGGGGEEGFVGGAGVEVGAAEGEDGGDGGWRGVAVHDVGDAGVVG